MRPLRRLLSLPLLLQAQACADHTPPASTPVASTTAPAPGPGADANLDAVLAWVGRYPGDTIDGVTLLDQPALHAALVATLGPTGLDELQTLSVQTPVSSDGAWVTMSFCQPHDCGAVNRTVAIGLGGGPLVVCQRDGSSERTWVQVGEPGLTEGDFRAPAPACPSEPGDLPATIRARRP